MKRWLAVATAAVLLLAACTSGGRGPPDTASAATPASGGTLRIFIEADGPPIAFWEPLWPVLEGTAALHRCCLLRRLFSYTGRPGDEGGAVAQPDLAAAMPDVSADGLTWTIAMKPGLSYAPPYEDREIVAGDVVAALERTARSQGPPALFASYFSVVTGFDGFASDDEPSIAGLETPDDHTLVVHLDEPAGDLPDRLSLNAAAPLPARAVVGHPFDYIRFLVASGPYMIEGSEDLDPTLRPRDQKPVAGFTNRHVTLVRNPSWLASSDRLRPAYPDRIEVLVHATAWDDPITQRDELRTERKVLRLYRAGELAVIADPSPALVRSVGQGEVAGRVVTERSTTMRYVPLNLAAPPFDDVHVRRALNLAFDREAFARTSHRKESFAVTTSWHLTPSVMQADRIEDSWRPSWGRGVTDEGNVDEARQEMARSRYDRDGDGRCDGEMCSFQVPIQPVQSIASASRPLLVAALAQLGIRIELVHVGEGDFWSMATSPAARLPLVPDFGWLPDYPNPSAFVVPLLYGESIRARQNFDVSLLGARPGQLLRWGYATTSVPSADARIERCLAMTGDAQAWCWTELDAYLMEAIVPVVPIGTVDHSWLLSPQVASFSVDQSTDLPAYDRVALAPEAGGTS